MIAWLLLALALFAALVARRARRDAQAVADLYDEQLRELQLVRLRFGWGDPAVALVDATLLDIAISTKYGGGHVDMLAGGYWLEFSTKAER